MIYLKGHYDFYFARWKPKQTISVSIYQTNSIHYHEFPQALGNVLKNNLLIYSGDRTEREPPNGEDNSR